jgi:hypothetical protein
LSKQEPRASQTIVNVPLSESIFPMAQVAVTATVAPHGHCLSFGRTAFHVFGPPLGMATVTGLAVQLVVTTTLSHVVTVPETSSEVGGEPPRPVTPVIEMGTLDLLGEKARSGAESRTRTGAPPRCTHEVGRARRV